MSALLYSHSYPPSTISLSPTESFLYPENFEKQRLRKVNGNLNNNNSNTNNIKRKQKFNKNNYYKKNNKNSNDKTKQSIFSHIKSSNVSGPIITPVTVCTHDKDFSKPQYSSHSTPICINNTANNIYYPSLHQSLDSNFSPLKPNHQLLINNNSNNNDKNLLYATSENPSMEDYMPTSEFNTIKPQDTEDEMLSLFPLNKQGENAKANSFDDINFQSMMNSSPNLKDNEMSEVNQMNNISEMNKMEDIALIKQLEHHKLNHTHHHYVENPFYYETTNLPALNSKVKPSYCCYCGKYTNKILLLFFSYIYFLFFLKKKKNEYLVFI